MHSPRPFLSPKQSYSKDPITHNSVPKSVRVEELERMADEVMATTTDLSADIPKTAPQTAVDELSEEPSNINKTLPKPPVSTRKEKRLSPLPERTRVDTYFATAPVPVPETAPVQPTPSERTPPTPTLTAVTPAKPPKAGYLGDNLRSESGLDALERRLLAEVGTRKIDTGERRPDVRSIVQPITIPTSKEPHEPLNDSAISSLTLAGEHEHDSDEKTHRAGKSSASGDEQAEERRKRRREREKEKGREGRSDKSGKEGERKAGRKREKERGKDGEGHKTRKSAAKGRVAAWLGEIDPEVPPMEEVAPPSSAVTKSPPHTFSQDGLPTFEVEGVVQIVPHAVTAEGEKDTDAGKTAEQRGDGLRKLQEDTPSAPNPRSSGFVPIGTLKRDTFQRPETKEMSVAEEARRVADIWSSPPVLKDKSPKLPVVAAPTHTPQSIRTDRHVSPPSSTQPDKLDSGKNPWQTVKQDHALKPASPSPKKIVQPSPRLPLFPPPRIDPEVKYDIRSARGGRGGKVTAVASIWASGALGSDPKPREIAKTTPDPSSTPKPTRAPIKSLLSSGPSTGEPKLVELAGKRTRPVVKSSSVPAMISSSHATPTLSTTASLARPAPHRVKPSVKVPTTITETHSEGVGRAQAAKMTPLKTANSGGDLAFGQARLRDLIKKYQGQAA